MTDTVQGKLGYPTTGFPPVISIGVAGGKSSLAAALLACLGAVALSADTRHYGSSSGYGSGGIISSGGFGGGHGGSGSFGGGHGGSGGFGGGHGSSGGFGGGHGSSGGFGGGHGSSGGFGGGHGGGSVSIVGGGFGGGYGGGGVGVVGGGAGGHGGAGVGIVGGGFGGHGGGSVGIIGGGSGGGYGGGAGSSCRAWCKNPQNQAYCCEDSSEPITIPVVKPGSCPPVRPQCPPVRSGYRPPNQCSNDSKCPGYEKCCYDTCLQHHTCKAPGSTW
ncbi:glycine-rich cell wall structural protein 2-like [Penaeus chinensis]|uniref:glycine-rich cell wall structural protein 2-like n=1 Tax=Penaeus chinensis TaxID=139456 RepID=UPI001FB7EE6C|nr:glycine-rich cell wall structural protein 2-like [Penaeus chinensis]